MKQNTQKGFVLPLITIMVALLAIGGSVYLIQKGKSTTPSTSISVTKEGSKNSSTTISDKATQTKSNSTVSSDKILTAEYALQNQESLLNKTITIGDIINIEYRCPDVPGANSDAYPCTSQPILGNLRTLNSTLSGTNLYLGTSKTNPPYTECKEIVKICGGWVKGNRYRITGVLTRPQGVGVMYFDVISKVPAPPSSSTNANVNPDTPSSEGSPSSRFSEVSLTVRVFNGKATCADSPCEIPVKGARVDIYSDTGILLNNTTSNDNGFATFSEVTAGWGPNYVLVVNASGFAAVNKTITAQTGENTLIVTLK